MRRPVKPRPGTVGIDGSSIVSRAGLRDGCRMPSLASLAARCASLVLGGVLLACSSSATTLAQVDGPVQARVRLVEEEHEISSHGAGCNKTYTVKRLLFEVRRGDGDWDSFYIDEIGKRGDSFTSALYGAPDGERFTLRMDGRWWLIVRLTHIRNGDVVTLPLTWRQAEAPAWSAVPTLSQLGDHLLDGKESEATRLLAQPGPGERRGTGEATAQELIREELVARRELPAPTN
jgi:hypothetical protein